MPFLQASSGRNTAAGTARRVPMDRFERWVVFALTPGSFLLLGLLVLVLIR
jgi:hypothetical protein